MHSRDCDGTGITPMNMQGTWEMLSCGCVIMSFMIILLWVDINKVRSNGDATSKICIAKHPPPAMTWHDFGGWTTAAPLALPTMQEPYHRLHLSNSWAWFLGEAFLAPNLAAFDKDQGSELFGRWSNVVQLGQQSDYSYPKGSAIPILQNSHHGSGSQPIVLLGKEMVGGTGKRDQDSKKDQKGEAAGNTPLTGSWNRWWLWVEMRIIIEGPLTQRDMCFSSTLPARLLAKQLQHPESTEALPRQPPVSLCVCAHIHPGESAHALWWSME